jgi:outer membrane lipoprotein SlyB
MHILLETQAVSCKHNVLKEKSMKLSAHIIGTVAASMALTGWAQSGVVGQPAQSAPTQSVAKPAAKVCTTCGRVEAVESVTKKGEGSGVGLVAGGVIGGVLGHQIGGGRGKDVATVAGAAGGAYAGHQVEKNMKKTTEYHVKVKMDDGKMRTMTFANQPGYRTGDRVTIVNGKLARAKP